MDESTIEPKFCVFCNDWHTPMECRGKIAVEAMQQHRRDLFEKVAVAMTSNPGLCSATQELSVAVISGWANVILESADKFANGEE